jgi:hypothetical protein
MGLRFKAILTALLLVVALASTEAIDAGAQGTRRPDPATPTPFDQGAAAEAGRQAGPPGGPGPVAVGAAAGPPTVFVARVFATQYNPNTPGSVEAAVPDKCAKFAALRNTSALSSQGCPAGYALWLDYRLLVIRDSGQAALVPVKDVGPWNTDDNYWDFGPGAPRPRRLFGDLPAGLPEAQTAFYTGYNQSANCKNLDGSLSGHPGGADQFGRCVLNPGGLDLSVAAASQLGLGHLQNEWVTVAFLWTPMRTNVVSVNSGRLADVKGGSKLDGAPIIQWSPNGGLNQQWVFEQVGDAYRIVSANTGKVLDVAGGSQAEGAAVIQWPWRGTPNQLWRVEPVAEGEFRIVSVHSGKVLDVARASTDPGATLLQWPWHGSANQRWRLSVVGTG